MVKDKCRTFSRYSDVTEVDKMMDTAEEGSEYKLLLSPYGQHTNGSAVLV
jgi:hypothetical protein